MAALRIFARFGLSPILRSSFLSDTRKATSPALLEVTKRWSNYKSSEKYDESKEYAKFEISKDPKEWAFVEQVLRKPTVPLPPKDKTHFPSGWVPQTANPKTYPYFVQRTKNHMQPIYLDKSFRGMRKLTVIRRIQGNIWALEAELKEYLEQKVRKKMGARVHEPACTLVFHGDHVSRVKEFLTAKGM
ncbi:probable 39S ribosomal protein L49, mitochondrial [Cephus cinctus]|uniref:Large ribosomal subunit protein mL49 n=1 Tax=Cephus cinctus TaxID=211228 RepID=A0AAJ7FE42_CEPCN|nr:probable 39S ribosomal protein L49, mitochondrial [Cephus cinctus]